MKLIKKISKFFSPQRKYLKKIGKQEAVIAGLQVQLGFLQNKLDAKGTFADLMRENLGSLTIDFTADKKHPDGSLSFRDYLDGLPEEDRIQRITQANELWKNEMFNIICNHLINKQGNLAIKYAEDNTQVLGARMTINGFALFRKEVERCHGLFEELTNPKKDFDPHEVY